MKRHKIKKRRCIYVYSHSSFRNLHIIPKYKNFSVIFMYVLIFNIINFIILINYSFRYAMLVGQPPFETATLNETYYRITANKYSIPSSMSESARRLVVKMLQLKPSDRPSLEEILQHEFFVSGYLPTSLPTSCCYTIPKFPLVALTKRWETLSIFEFKKICLKVYDSLIVVYSNVSQFVIRGILPMVCFFRGVRRERESLRGT